MNILKALLSLLSVLKFALPFLRSAAEKAFKKLPKEKQEELIKISKMVEVIKQMMGYAPSIIYPKIYEVTGLDNNEVDSLLREYYKQKGIIINDYAQVFAPIWQDADNRTETGLKSLWAGISNIVSSVVAEIDWQLLLMGVGEFVYRTFVKGKVKI